MNAPALRLAVGLAASSLLPGFAGCQPDRARQQHRLAERYVAFWNTGDTEGADAVLRPDYELRYAPGFEVHLKGIDAFRKEMARLHTLGFTVQVEEIVGGADAITVRWTCRASYPNSAGGPPRIVSAVGLSLLHLREGKIADEWIAYDRKAWLEQLGYEMKPK